MVNPTSDVNPSSESIAELAAFPDAGPGEYGTFEGERKIRKR